MPRERLATELNLLFKRYGPLEFDSEAEATLFWRDWLADLADWPADLVEEACRSWRNSPAKYRPRTAGQLKPLIVEEWNRRKAMWLMVQDARRVEATPDPEPPKFDAGTYPNEHAEMVFKMNAFARWQKTGETSGVPELERAQAIVARRARMAREAGFPDVQSWLRGKR